MLGSLDIFEKVVIVKAQMRLNGQGRIHVCEAGDVGSDCNHGEWICYPDWDGESKRFLYERWIPKKSTILTIRHNQIKNSTTEPFLR